MKFKVKLEIAGRKESKALENLKEMGLICFSIDSHYLTNTHSHNQKQEGQEGHRKRRGS